MRKILIILLFFISSCKNKPPHFQPESEYLPKANVNKKHVAFIFIAGGAIGKESINVIITPDNSGLTWKPKVRLLSYGEVQENYHRISNIEYRISNIEYRISNI
ncbi:hypothetical protein, partial [Pectobacterium sp. B1J-3]|uniref:hypothetical protein n=1 Tax=Pectobacterium sp. B1J-3 TaxID=3385371 RepID=UPI0039060221